jgi:hypothetical protein
MSQLPGVSGAFSRVWKHDADHYDETYDCSYDDCSTDTKGNRTCTRVPKTCTRYSHTWHTFTFNRSAATTADQALNSYLASHPDLVITERLTRSKETGPENEYAIERTFKGELKGKIPTPEQSLHYANIWGWASNLEQLRDPIIHTHNGLRPLSSNWSKLVPVEKTRYHYRTESKTDPGPPGKQLADRIAGQTSELNGATSKVVIGLQTCSASLNRIVQVGREFIAIELDNKPGDGDKKRAELLRTQETAYAANYMAGPKQNPFDHYAVAAYTIGGIIGGGLLGLGMDRVVTPYLAQRRRLKPELRNTRGHI